MKITRIKSWSENLELTRPYSIAYQTTDSVENVFVYLETDGGLIGMGSGAPVESITGESMDDCKTVLSNRLEELLLGKDIRLIKSHCRTLEKELQKTPAARAAVDIALYDVYAKFLRLPLVDVLGKEHHSLPTSITIGIKSVEESVSEAMEYMGRGFRILKVKTGNSVEEDIERLFKIREKAGYFRVENPRRRPWPTIDRFLPEPKHRFCRPYSSSPKGGTLIAKEASRLPSLPSTHDSGPL